MIRTLVAVVSIAVAAVPGSRTPPDPARIYAALRSNDLPALAEVARLDPNQPDRQGMTPLMHAAAVGTLDAIRLLLDAGARVDARNAFGATALICANGEPLRSRLLIEHGADVEATTSQGRTPLLVAAGRDGNVELVRLLLARGARPNVRADSGETPLLVATRHGDPETVAVLIAAGAEVNPTGTPLGMTPLGAAVSSGRVESVGLLLAHGARTDVPAMDDAAKVKNGVFRVQRISALMLAAPYGTPATTEALLRAGVGVDERDARGMTALMLAVASDRADPGVVRALLAAGADVHVRSEDGETALDWARKFNRPEIVGALLTAGSHRTAPRRAAQTAPAQVVAVSTRAALQRAIGLLQRSSATFEERAGCVGCHHQPATAMAVAAARQAGLSVDEPAAADAADVMRDSAAKFGTRVLQGAAAGSGIDIVLGHAEGLAAAGHTPDAVTDGLVLNLLIAQRTDGRWTRGPALARPPINDGDIGRTARGMAALATFGPPALRPEIDERIARAGRWLLAQAPLTTDDGAMRLLGLVRAQAEPGAVTSAGRALLARQRPDGGWAGTRDLASDAWSTGMALQALRDSGQLRPSDTAHRRGVRFLRRRQLADGSWQVRSRAVEVQPYFESGFPHGHDQWISASATAAAATALAADVRAETGRRTRPRAAARTTPSSPPSSARAPRS